MYRIVVKRILFGLAIVVLGACASVSPRDSVRPLDGDPLSTWNDTATKQAILDFVAEVTQPDGPSYLPAESRLATFDFDGTIGCEKPDYMEVIVAATRLCELTVDDPSKLDEPIYRAACDRDYETLNANVEDVLLTAFLGESQTFYVDYVEHFLDTARHARFNRPYGELHYLPMVQLIDYLHANDFAVHIVSGSQQGFTRTYGGIVDVDPARTIGHVVELDFSTADDDASLIRQDAFLPPSIDGGGKAEAIRNRIGQRPILAFGNSMGDFEMLQYATSGDAPGLALILVHDDPDEYEYRDETLIEHAQELDWQIVSMKDDFAVVFPD
ncbi:MAG: HAD family hydrolase [Acidobacteriota bacterium]